MVSRTIDYFDTNQTNYPIVASLGIAGGVGVKTFIYPSIGDPKMTITNALGHISNYSSEMIEGRLRVTTTEGVVLKIPQVPYRIMGKPAKVSCQ